MTYSEGPLALVAYITTFVPVSVPVHRETVPVESSLMTAWERPPARPWNSRNSPHVLIDGETDLTDDAALFRFNFQIPRFAVCCDTNSLACLLDVPAPKDSERIAPTALVNYDASKGNIVQLKAFAISFTSFQILAWVDRVHPGDDMSNAFKYQKNTIFGHLPEKACRLACLEVWLESGELWKAWGVVFSPNLSHTDLRWARNFRTIRQAQSILRVSTEPAWYEVTNRRYDAD
ncbi:hypothetical protein FA15DRAFT_708315 [Coprinopsis marcescibilis]|uniref:Uncharacterized protein n=1 Tax=Coprinopsis marcescibilis TaxID=230819 RepID=A0A5C3KJ78_COPMA|nr:hypothetical protein FA15DRAFT_708315 [Coprinopsis marcescibilis]